MVKKGKLTEKYPNLAKEWHPTKNGDQRPEMFSAGSNKKVWWKCVNGHEWKACINHRAVRGQGCPFCSGRVPIKGKNDLLTTNQVLTKEWNYEKNGYLKPENVSAGSSRKVWWKCSKCGYEWQAIINARVKGRGCPNCREAKWSNERREKLVEERKSFVEENPTLFKEWHPTKNGDLRPEMFSAGSNKKVWWKCVNGHEWKASIVSRVKGDKCPICSKQKRTSFIEQAIFFYVHLAHSDAVSGYHDDSFRSMELDIFIPSLLIGIEYDGAVWHRGEKARIREKKKYDICKENHITLFRFREIASVSDKEICDVVLYAKKSDNDTIRQLSEYGLVPENIDVDRDRTDIQEQYMFLVMNNSLALRFPKIAAEWHPTKNGSLTPEMFQGISGQRVWWKCENGHEWQSAISQRTFSKSGCPYCSNQKVLAGYNDLKTTNPEICEEWHPTKNGDLRPEMFVPGSGKKVWWKCSKCGYEWQADIKNRVKGIGCPKCANKVPSEGENDLLSVNPSLAREWNLLKNGSIKPNSVLAHSGKKYWWICANGHEWQASVDNRIKGRNCPYCSNKKVLAGYNDLKTTNPEICEEWHPTKNGDLRPEMFVPGSGKKVWWKCSKCGHEWQTEIRVRTKGHGCPKCNQGR